MERLKQLASAAANDEIVLLKVTDSTTCFRLSKALLCDTCAYFRAALKGQFEEAAKKEICLPGTDEETAEVFVFWLLQRTMPDFTGEIKAMPGDRTEVASYRLVLLAHTWMLGDRINAPKLQNAAVQETMLIMEQYGTPADAIESVYHLAPAGSKLSDLFLVAARYEYLAKETLTDTHLEALASIPDFLKRFMKPVRKLLRDDPEEFTPPWDSETWRAHWSIDG